MDRHRFEAGMWIFSKFVNTISSLQGSVVTYDKRTNGENQSILSGRKLTND